ncbi:MAG: (Fe-S)-binding protein [Bacteroidetes bacterium]|nr:(Fe-S)-binding protein [Bacteroidota bacterium]MCL2302208.1 (Fe-S)-binding protein [Lentimicrobiaceae bacterium]MCL2302288.1 (Fe-S)-binding protein [Lentimicrobiaceae bacterium]
MPQYFNPFIIPFCIGVILLFGICLFKWIRWIKNFDRLQRAILFKNIISWKFIPAIWEMITEALFHRKVFKHRFLLGYMHTSIALGWFLLIVVGAIETSFAIGGKHPLWVPIFFRYFGKELPHFEGEMFFNNLMDLLLCIVLSGVLIALFKRIYSRIVGMKKAAKHVIFDKFAMISLWLIFPLRLIAESVTASRYHNGGFLTNSFGELINYVFPTVSNNTFWYLETTWWLFYSLALAVFFVSLPFSRYMHILTEPLLIYFRKLGLHENDKPTGFTKFELSACSRCGICIDNCPLNKELKLPDVQSIYLLRDLRYKRLKEEIANNCLLCDRCVTDCPVGLELTKIRRQTRYKNELDTQGNYKYVDAIQPFNAIGRVAYFSGCMTHLTPGIIEAIKNIFEAAGQKYWHIDAEKTICCGRPLLQQGFEQQATELRRKNTALIRESNATLLVTSCPICYQSFKKEYKLNIPVVHHTEYIEQCIKENKLFIKKQDLKVVYHDPCELGRGCKIYKAPRNVLKKVANLISGRNEKQKSFCCGFNLGNLAIDSEAQKKIRDAALHNLLENKPDLIVTACPMCKKAFAYSSDFQVKDVAEIINESLEN